MNLYPILDIIETAQTILDQGGDFHIQFRCAACGAKQTIAEANIVYKLGRCEECSHITNIVDAGANILAILPTRRR